MAFRNEYAHRKVAETSAKSCEICFKPSTSVLITADNKDFFYVCPSHLKDPGFCTPKIDQAAIEARKKKELEEEIERVKKEYEEKKKKKEEKEKKDKDKKDKDKKKDDKEKKEDDKKDDDKAESKEEVKTPPPVEDEEPRVFELKATFYQGRLKKKRDAEIAKRQAEISKRNWERLQDPSLFPSVPKKLP
ncbi:VPS4-associated protein 1 [Apodospora peruviana]|uniref:VPS4-associated protein 1 n=1 Tax=Apodospora peruviana TaxID=516989 RepID=A0AAE0LYU6_9PEZI|nr:VPS4-associated protein 1 [Apodospora peruviana]